MTTGHRAWYRELTPYHWFVFVVASAAWFFDCLDQRLFSLARNDAVKALAAGADDQALGTSPVLLGGLTLAGAGAATLFAARRRLAAQR